MNYLKNAIRIAVCIGCVSQLTAGEPKEEYHNGLRVEFFGSPHFERPQGTAVTPGPELDWRQSKGNDWAARFSGVLRPPVTGRYALRAKADSGVRVFLAGKKVIDGWARNGARKGHATLVANDEIPVIVEYFFEKSQGGTDPILRLFWTPPGGKEEKMPNSAFNHSAPAEPASVQPQNTYPRIENAQHIVVYQERSKFLGWPANNGVWTADGVNMLVGFTHGDYQLNRGDHNIGGNQVSWLARSTDMGQTWTAYDPPDYVGDFGNKPERKTVKKAIDFSQPQFAMRIVGTAYHGAHDERGHFFYSYNAGKTWNGPYRLGVDNIREWPELENTTLPDNTDLTPRTDYVVEDKDKCLVFMSVRATGQFGTDRLFCIRTVDGGKTFKFVGWVVPPFDKNKDDVSEKVKLEEDDSRNPHPNQCRAVMSQTVRLKNGKLVCAMRRRHGRHNWVDAYASSDNGHSWSFLSEVGDAGAGNGNPPALSVTGKDRLVAVFGNRKEPGTMMVVYSDDEGETWSEPKVLRDGYGSVDMETVDLGYPQLLKRKDGKMVAFYYWSTKDCLHHIAATIWDADN
jgi:hypothetical protein